jgi:hypothetical protein
LARADALQVELDQTRGELEATKARLAFAELGRKRERDESASRSAQLSKPGAGDTKRSIAAALVGAWIILGVVIAVAAFAWFVWSRISSLHQDDDLRERVSQAYDGHWCTIDSFPEGATVNLIEHATGDLVEVGHTPINTLLHVAKLELRLDGYEPARIDVRGRVGCTEFVTLKPQH